MSAEIEFYQRLSEHIPEEAARLIAERMADRQLEVKVDALAARVDSKFAALVAKVDALTGKVDAIVEHGATRVEVERLRSSFFRWNLAFFVPLWVGTYATLVAIVLRSAP